MTDLDPITLSVFVKALDFLFDQGAKIMQERREKRAHTPVESKQPAIEQNKKNIMQSISTSINTSEIEHCMYLIEQQLKNKHILEKQVALSGSRDYAPLPLQNQLTSVENELKKQIDHLKLLIQDSSKVEINIPGLE